VHCGGGSRGRPVSESGRLRHGDGGHEGGDRRRRVLVLPTLSTMHSLSSPKQKKGAFTRRRPANLSNERDELVRPRAVGQNQILRLQNTIGNRAVQRLLTQEKRPAIESRQFRPKTGISAFQMAIQLKEGAGRIQRFLFDEEETSESDDSGWDSAVNTVSDAAGDVGSWASETAGSAWDAASGAASEVGSWAGETAGSTWDTAGDVASDAWGAVSGVASDAWGAVSEAASDAWDAASGAAGEVWDQVVGPSEAESESAEETPETEQDADVRNLFIIDDLVLFVAAGMGGRAYFESKKKGLPAYKNLPSGSDKCPTQELKAKYETLEEQEIDTDAAIDNAGIAIGAIPAAALAGAIGAVAAASGVGAAIGLPALAAAAGAIVSCVATIRSTNAAIDKWNLLVDRYAADLAAFVACSASPVRPAATPKPKSGVKQ
jgi:hypothetical protein